MTLIDRYPEHLRTSPEFAALQDAIGAEVTQVRGNLHEILLQLNVATATWGLSLWEEQVGIQTDVSKPDAERRERIISRLRGTGTVTVPMLKNLAESFSGGEVEIVEHPESYSFEVIFVGTRGIPPNMADLSAAIDESKPAHLAYTYVYTYNTYGTLSGYTHAQLAAYTHTELREAEL